MNLSVKLATYQRADKKHQVILEYSINRKQYRVNIPMLFASKITGIFSPDLTTNENKRIMAGYNYSANLILSNTKMAGEEWKKLMQIYFSTGKELTEVLDMTEYVKDMTIPYNEGEGDYAKMNKLIKDVTTPSSGKEKPSLIDLYNEWVATEYADNQKHQQLLRVTGKYLEQFVAVNNIEVEMINARMFEQLEKFLQKIPSLTGLANLSDGTIQTIRKRVKKFGEWLAQEKGYNYINLSSVKIKVKKNDVISISFADFVKIFDHDFGKEDLNIARDWFCFMTSIGGIRINTLSLMVKNGMQVNLEQNYIEFLNNKGNAKRIVHNPLNYFSRAFLAKYGSNLPKLVSEQKLNQKLKKIAQIIDRDQLVMKHAGGDSTAEVVSLSDVFSTKFARKAAVSINFELGIPREISDRFTAHVNSLGASDYYRQITFAQIEKEISKWDQAYFKLKGKSEDMRLVAV